uniref:Uncharacterized protein n=1 Tax=Xiphophorus couchianus TaxID=32473 RepID=A0A3B5L6Y1_9TELE
MVSEKNTCTSALPGLWNPNTAIRSLGMQRMPPRLSWSQCPSSSYSLSHTHPHTHTPARPQMQTHTVFISIFTRTTVYTFNNYL